MRHGVVRNQCCGGEEGLAFCGKQSGKGWNLCQQVQACSWDACDSSFLQCQQAEAATAVPQQACHRSESLFISFCGLLKTARLLVHGC